MNYRGPEETALVLGGGGAKGAYEIGAIEALSEMGIYAGSVYGTSVGSINAALYAQGGGIEAGKELWHSLRMEDVLGEDSLAISEDMETIFNHPEKLVDFFSKYAHHKGMDISPLVQLLKKTIDEDAVRRSPIHMGLVTTKFPSLEMIEKKKENMEPGSLHEWILASAACFPLFPMQQIGNDKYIDGGYCDNTPVEMAIRDGARQIIAIDIGNSYSHTQYNKRPNVLYIRTSHPLGGMLDFYPERSETKRQIGYYDTLRVFGKLRGTHFYFDAEDVRKQAEKAEDYVLRLSRFEAALKGFNAVSRRNDNSPFFGLLEADLPSQPDWLDYYLRACELCGEIAGLEDLRVYTFDSFRNALVEALPLERANEMLDSVLGGRIGALFAGPSPDRKLIVSCLCALLKKENAFSTLLMRTLSSFPKEMLCALTLREILRDQED